MISWIRQRAGTLQDYKLLLKSYAKTKSLLNRKENLLSLLILYLSLLREVSTVHNAWIYCLGVIQSPVSDPCDLMCRLDLGFHKHSSMFFLNNKVCKGAQ